MLYAFSMTLSCKTFTCFTEDRNRALTQSQASSSLGQQQGELCQSAHGHCCLHTYREGGMFSVFCYSPVKTRPWIQSNLQKLKSLCCISKLIQGQMSSSQQQLWGQGLFGLDCRTREFLLKNWLEQSLLCPAEPPPSALPLLWPVSYLPKGPCNFKSISCRAINLWQKHVVFCARAQFLTEDTLQDLSKLKISRFLSDGSTESYQTLNNI